MKTAILFALASIAFAYPANSPAADPSYAAAAPVQAPVADSTYDAPSAPVQAPVAEPTYNAASAPVASAPSYDAPAASPVSYGAENNDVSAYSVPAAAPVSSYGVAAAPVSSYGVAAEPVSSYGVVAAQPTIIPVPVYSAPDYNEPLLANTWRGRDYGRFEDVLSSVRRNNYGAQYSPYFFGKRFGYGSPISNPFYDGKDDYSRRYRKHRGGKKHRKHHSSSSSSSSEEH